MASYNTNEFRGGLKIMMDCHTGSGNLFHQRKSQNCISFSWIVISLFIFVLKIVLLWQFPSVVMLLADYFIATSKKKRCIWKRLWFRVISGGKASVKD